MADYTAKARSNYFHLRDTTALHELTDFARAADLEILPTDTDPLRVALLSRADHGSWPTQIIDYEAHDAIDLEIPAHVSQWLADGTVAVFLEIGSEKMRYLSGQAVAINNRGEERTLDLHDIYALAAELGTDLHVLS